MVWVLLAERLAPCQGLAEVWWDNIPTELEGDRAEGGDLAGEPKIRNTGLIPCRFCILFSSIKVQLLFVRAGVGGEVGLALDSPFSLECH